MTLDDVLARYSADLRAQLIALRRAIHQEPELAMHESATAARLDDALDALGIGDVRRVGETGLAARIPGRRIGVPCVAIRGDIDALPIHEATGLPYASRRPGVMHACGHDVHAAWAVGAAALLAQQPPLGDVVVILQPAEETGRGALAMLESGVLDDVRAIFGAHVDRRFALGQVVADEGPLAASADMFEIELIGAGAHAARPHEGRDPIVAMAAVITALQTIVARRLNPATAGVVTVAMVNAGSAPNVIPDRARAAGTVRAVEPESRSTMLHELERIVAATAAAHDVEARLHVEYGTPPIVNPPMATSWARRAATAVVGREQVVPLGFVNLAAEDFAHYMARIPGCFLRIGAREPGGAMIPAHAATFYPAEESIFVGAAVLAECARVASAELASGA